MGERAQNLMWNADETLNWLRAEFPQAFMYGRNYEAEALKVGHARVRLLVDDGHLRPGGTISGPAMMELVDFGAYFLILAHHGAGARLSVTTNLNISFLRKPPMGDIACEVDILKHGKTLIVLRACILSSADDTLIGNTEMTYFNATGES